MMNKLLAVIGASLLLAACETTTDSHNGDTAIVSAAPGTAEDFKNNIKDRVFFDYDKSGLSEDAKKTIMAQAEWLKKYSTVKVVVEGHTDTRGTAAYNLALGAKRADAAKHYLISCGIEASRITTISFGKEKALTGDTEQVHAQNRVSVTVVQ